MAKERWVFECFASPLYINGRKQLIGIAEAEKLHHAAVVRGFTTKSGAVRKRLAPLEGLVILLRVAFSAEEFDHEWWAAEAMKPEWVRRLDTMFRGGWLYFPARPTDFTARKIAERVGFQLALSERRLGLSLKNKQYLKRIEAAELSKAQRGLDAEERAKVRVIIPGYKNFAQLAAEAYTRIGELRQHVMGLAGVLRERESAEFVQGLNDGTQRAEEADLGNDLSEFNEREEVAEILSEGWWEISRMNTRRQITDYVISRLPDRRRDFLQKSRNQPADQQQQYKRFVERLRQTFYEKLRLRPARRGRPLA